MHSPDTPYHPGELRVQRMAGVERMAERVGKMFRSDVPPVAQQFLAARPWILLGAADRRGRTWASLLSGRPGFARALDQHTLEIDGQLDDGDPLRQALHSGLQVGLLSIDLAARKRMRVNGEISGTAPLRVRAQQVYSNCPKYIQARDTRFVAAPGAAAPDAVRRTTLDDSARQWISSADTFFIASRSGAGADISHRGGRPGFVRVEQNRVSWPDYSGNAMFNTLGNLAENPSAGLLFVDFERGGLLQVSGRATIDWSPQRAGQWNGAERVVDLAVDEVVVRAAAAALAFGPAAASPFNP